MRSSRTAAAAFALLAAGCSDVASTRDVRVTIVDETGAPVPGAVFYAEVRDANGPFAFETRIAGRAGEVPDSAYEPLKLPWRRDARVAFAAFAPGRRPAVLRLDEQHPRTDGVLLTLSRAGSSWNEALRGLSFPFEDAPELSDRLRQGGHEGLLEAFREAWEARADGPPPLSDAELRKLVALGLR